MEIRLENVSKSYQGLSLGPVNLRVPSGTLMVLEGANGSGKTTLLELIAGTVEPDAGKVLLGGRKAEDLAPIDRGVFYIPQTLHKFWSMQHDSRLCFIPRRTVRENLLAAAGDYGEAQEWMCRLDLEDYADETPERLSFGLQQRLALARALLIRPGIILVDEGLSSLDPEIRLEVFDILRRVPERTGNTVVYVTHHKDDADRLGGDLYRFRDGNLFRAPSGERGAGRSLRGLDASLDTGETKARLMEAFAIFLDCFLETGRPERLDDVRAKVQENLEEFRPTHPGGLAEYGEESADFLSAQMLLGDSSAAFKKNLARWLGVERALLEGGPEGIRERLLGRGSPASPAGLPAATECGAVIEVSRDSDGGRPVRCFSVEHVLSAVQSLIEGAPGSAIRFGSFDFFADHLYAEKLLRGLRRIVEGGRVELRFETDLRHLDEELMRLCDFEGVVLTPRIDSINPASWEARGGRMDVQEQDRKIRLLRRLAPRAKVSLRLILGLPGDDLDGFLRSLEWAQRVSSGECEVYRAQILPGSELRAMAIRRGLSYDPSPPYKVRSTPTFSARDLQGAEAVSWLVRTLMTSPAIRESMERAALKRGRRWSYVGACREIATRLKRRGIRFLEEWHQEWTRSVPAGAHPAEVSWPGGTAAKEQLAVLREMSRCFGAAARPPRTVKRLKPRKKTIIRTASPSRARTAIQPGSRLILLTPLKMS